MKYEEKARLADILVKSLREKYGEDYTRGFLTSAITNIPDDLLMSHFMFATKEAGSK